MDLLSHFEFHSQLIPVKNIFDLTEAILSDLYTQSNEVEGLNIYFHLQYNYYSLLKNNHFKEAAHICYLMSYYLFVPLTPPHSESLALEFATKAEELNPNEKYVQWIEYVLKGN